MQSTPKHPWEHTRYQGGELASVASLSLMIYFASPVSIEQTPLDHLNSPQVCRNQSLVKQIRVSQEFLIVLFISFARTAVAAKA